MTEPVYHRDANQPETTRKDVYIERQVDTVNAPVDEAARDIYTQRVSGPAGASDRCEGKAGASGC